MKKLFFLTLVSLFLMFTTSCGDDTNSEASNDDDPKVSSEMNKIVPSADTMSIDFASFNTANPDSAATAKRSIIADLTPDKKDMDPNEGACWLIGSAAVLWSNAVCFVPLAIPIGIYKELKDRVPTKVTDNLVEWGWSGPNHSALVSATKSDGEYNWEWSVAIDSFVWITGGSMEDKSKGWWQFHSPNLDSNANTTIRVDWTRNSKNSVKFTNNNKSEKDTKFGDYIEYEKSGDDISVFFHDVHKDVDKVKDAGDLSEIKVYWNQVSKAGGIEVVTGDGNSCAWDPND